MFTKYLRMVVFVFSIVFAACTSQVAEMVTTTAGYQWHTVDVKAVSDTARQETLVIDSNAKGQTIMGFGTAFSELSYDALSILSQEDRNAIYGELFSPGVGASFTVCRTPLGASDFARGYYSYNDIDGDFSMEHFSIERDREGLLPIIKSALAKNPDLKIWASPWCPPVWLKNNKHYASAAMNPMMLAFLAGVDFNGIFNQDVHDRRMLQELLKDTDLTQYLKPGVIADNGITPEQIRREGTDSFTMEDKYLNAYALYFKKYIEAYREEGVDIFMVMPQNEPNSAQWYTSCTWTPEGLARFERVLGPAMEELGVELYHGTMERADWHQAERCIEDEIAGKYIKGVAFQWGGKEALPEIHRRYPDLTMVMSEHQCFNGQNSWEDCMDSWDLLKFYMDNGVALYDYWNLALKKDGVSTWGWRQNSLVLVDEENKSYKWNYEYYLMKHISHYVLPGAVYLGTSGSQSEALAFKNPDGRIIILVAEKEGVERKLSITFDKKTLSVPLAPDSISTIVIKES